METPRSAKIGVLSPTIEVSCRFATLVTSESTLVVRDAASASPEIAETEIGTSCKFSERLAAVTTISPPADASSSPLACAQAGEDEMATASARADGSR